MLVSIQSNFGITKIQNICVCVLPYRDNYRYYCSALSALSRYRLFCYRTTLIHRMNYKVCMYVESLIGLVAIKVRNY